MQATPRQHGTAADRPTCTAIVCACNEERTLAGVLDGLLGSARIDEVVVVDAGSTDGTAQTVERYAGHGRVQGIRLEHNRGKGYAMAEAASRAHGETLLFVDAGLAGFGPGYVAQLLGPLVAGEADMVIGYPAPRHGLAGVLAGLGSPRSLSGERALWRRDVMPLLGQLRASGYGAETALNLHYRRARKRVRYLPLEGLLRPAKLQRHGFGAAGPYAREPGEIGRTLAAHRPAAIKVYFEVTNHCNFSCDFCPSRDSGRPRRHMDWALFQKGVDEVARERIAGTVGYHILGEPLLYPRIYEAVRYAHDLGLRTEMNTNGSLLTPERVQGLIDAGLDNLSISLQVMGEDEHECRGSGMTFGRYYGRIMEAVRLIHASSSALEVNLCFMNTSTARYFDIDRLLRTHWRRDARESRLLPLVMDVHAAIGKAAEPDEVRRALRRFNLTRPTFIRLDGRTTVFVQPLADWGNAFTARRVHPAPIGYCAYALTNVGVLADGQVTICCADYDGHTSLGNLQRESLAELLRSEQAERVRAGLRRLQLTHPYCQRCVGSPSRVKALFKGLASIYLFRLLAFQPGRAKEVALFPA